MFKRAIHSRFFRLIYSSPKQRDIFRCVIICIYNIYLTIYVNAFKNFIGAFPNVFAYVARLARIRRFYNHKINSTQQTFVGQKRTQLGKIPFAHFGTKLFIPSFGRESDIRQVLNRNSFTKFFCALYKRFADCVINNCCRSFLLARKPFEQLPTIPFDGTFGSVCLCLDRTANRLLIFPIRVKPLSRMTFSIGSRNNIGHTEINTDKFLYIFNFFVRHLNRLKKIKFSFFVDQIRLAFNIRKVVSVVTHIGHFKSASDRPQRHNIVWFVGQYTCVIRNAAQRFKNTFGFLVNFVCVRHFGYATNDNLRRKFTRIFDWMIRFIMKPELLKYFSVPRDGRNSITNSIGLFHRFQQKLRLFIIGKQFYFESQFHLIYLNSKKKLKTQVQEKIIFKSKKESWQFLPSAEDRWVSLPTSR